MQLTRIIYASVASADLEYDEVTSILRSATTRNEAQGITGILCFSDDVFLQVLEGPRSDVNQLYNMIIRDPRHKKVELLSAGEIDQRDFADWSMKLISWDCQPTAQRRALLLRHSRTTAFEPFGMTARQAHGFLCELAELERRPSLVAA